MSNEPIRLHPGHPYLKQFTIDVIEMGPGRWSLRWRDFLSIKQDIDYEGSREGMLQCLEEIRRDAALVEPWWLADACTTFEEAEAFWKMLDAEPK